MTPNHHSHHIWCLLCSECWHIIHLFHSVWVHYLYLAEHKQTYQYII